MQQDGSTCVRVRLIVDAVAGKVVVGAPILPVRLLGAAMKATGYLKVSEPSLGISWCSHKPENKQDSLLVTTHKHRYFSQLPGLKASVMLKVR